jgi:hypothetical protein
MAHNVGILGMYLYFPPYVVRLRQRWRQPDGCANAIAAALCLQHGTRAPQRHLALIVNFRAGGH